VKNIGHLKEEEKSLDEDFYCWQLYKSRFYSRRENVLMNKSPLDVDENSYF